MNNTCNSGQVAVPLDSLKLPYTEDGITKEIPALNRKWVTERYYVPFWPPPQKEGAAFQLGAKESWLERTRFFCRDMKWLLQLQHHQFWSQMVFDSGAIATAVSFLQEAPPFYVMNEVLSDEEIWAAFGRAHRLVLQIILRLTTCHESESSFMTPKLHADLLYDYYLVTIPVLMDLCTVCWPTNRPLLQRIFNDIFAIQPKYASDLNKSVACIAQVLDSVSQCLGLSPAPVAEGEQAPERLNERLSTHVGPLTPALLQDLVMHTLDTASSLAILTDVCTEACTEFHVQAFEIRLVWFYENVVPELFVQLENLVNVDEDPVLFVSLKNKLDTGRMELLKSFRHILFSFINMAVESKDSQAVMSSVDDYVNVLTECLAERLFIRDYHQMYNVGHDLDVLAQLSPDMDAMKRTYILEAVIDCLDGPEMSPCPMIASKLPSAFPLLSSNSAGGSSQKANEQQDVGAGAKASGKVVGVKLESLISQVHDVLPHLGEGFIEQCLEHFDYKSADVIHAVLEGRLPADLASLDQSLRRETLPEDKELQQRVDTRETSDDESKGPRFARAHKGKRNDVYRDVLMLINDKSHREECRDFYTSVSLYEDEYDDTYDEHLDVSVGDDPDDPERFRRGLPKKAASGTPEESSEEGSSDDEGIRDQFVANPEKVRAQREMQRQSKMGAQGPRGDVVGRPKGQGQEKNVVASRNQKTTQKSQRANHNRRAGAQWKRRQGMLP